MIENQLNNLLVFLQTNPIIAVVAGVIVVALFYAKPKEMFKLVAFILFIMVVFYFITLFAGTVTSGSKQKDQMIYKSRDVIGD